MTTLCTSDRSSLLGSPVRRAVMDVLESLPTAPTASEPWSRSHGLTAADLADRLDRHVTTLRFHLEQLVDAGLITFHDERLGVGRPRRFFRVTEQTEDASAYRMLTEVLADAMASEITPEEAGVRWAQRHVPPLMGDEIPLPPATTVGRWLSKIGLLIDLLTAWGHAPETESTGTNTVIELTHCPLHELPLSKPDALDSLHVGLVRGSLDALGEPDVGVHLEPDPHSGHCTIRISPRTDFSAQKGTR